ncbi:chalcone isomerase family protein [Shewanella olleyana]|uniref:chalcone isomerase family protein n=1 Tax=Shewanella olleyana TaxID=135626 RepID=UPI00200C5899|nr:chalcone isomerase family protein [Shewanella olleyana]MCL1067208.1 chalcone isomerase family protein [Shewanella olleyana]
MKRVNLALEKSVQASLSNLVISEPVLSNSVFRTPLIQMSFLFLMLVLVSALVSKKALADQLESTPGSELKYSTQSHQQSLSPLQMVGEADMNLLWFSIYSAKLMSVDGDYQHNQFPLKLEIQYHRDIEAEDLVEATVDQWQHIGIAEQDIPRLQQQIEQAWPDVKEGDKLSFMMHNHDLGQFYFNDKPLPLIEEAGFSKAFLGIWLSEKTSRPKLRKQLIGADK